MVVTIFFCFCTKDESTKGTISDVTNVCTKIFVYLQKPKRYYLDYVLQLFPFLLLLYHTCTTSVFVVEHIVFCPRVQLNDKMNSPFTYFCENQKSAFKEAPFYQSDTSKRPKTRRRNCRDHIISLALLAAEYSAWENLEGKS